MFLTQIAEFLKTFPHVESVEVLDHGQVGFHTDEDPDSFDNHTFQFRECEEALQAKFGPHVSLLANDCEGCLNEYIARVR